MWHKSLRVTVQAAKLPNAKSVLLDQLVYDTTAFELLDGEWLLNNMTMSDWDEKDAVATMTFSANKKMDGDIFRYTFRVKDTAKVGNYTIRYHAVINQENASGQDVPLTFAAVPAVITVTSVIRGDVDGNETVNSNDAIHLLRYTLSPNAYPINQDGDMDGNNIANSNDAVLLLRHALSPAKYVLSEDRRLQILALVNEERAKNGVAPLTYRYDLQPAADIRVEEIIVDFSHTRPNGTSCFTVLREIGATYHAAGENIAAGYPNVSAVMKAWMNSSGHRANILDERFTGVAVGIFRYDRQIYWVQNFIG